MAFSERLECQIYSTSTLKEYDLDLSNVVVVITIMLADALIEDQVEETNDWSQKLT